MNKKILIILVITTLILSSSCNTKSTKKVTIQKPILKATTQKPTLKAAAYKLTKDYVRGDKILEDIKYLSSKKCDGRLVGTKGNELAGDYIANKFSKLGLVNCSGIKNFKQCYKQNTITLNASPVLEIVDKNNKLIKKFRYVDNFIGYVSSGANIKGDSVCSSYLINTFEKLEDTKEFEGKILLISKDIISIGSGLESFISGSGSKAAAIVLEENLNTKSRRLKRFSVSLMCNLGNEYSNSNKPMVIRAESSTFNKLAASIAQNNKIHISENYEYKKNITAFNVVGKIEGVDKALKEDTIIIGAHFDHMGNNMDGTYNPGALDNASGTACMMELARVLKEKHLIPKKTILFAAFNGEEVGGLGSSNFVNNPPCSLCSSVMINLDMEGFKNKRPTYLDNINNSDTFLRDDFMNLAKKLSIKVSKGVEEGSDHYTFASSGIDAVLVTDSDMSKIHTSYDTYNNLDKKDLQETTELVLNYIIENGF